MVDDIGASLFFESDLLFDRRRFNKERLKSSKKLKLILDALEEKQVWKDHALMAAVEQLVRISPNSPRGFR
jgi:hypothetical protein